MYSIYFNFFLISNHGIWYVWSKSLILGRWGARVVSDYTWPFDFHLICFGKFSSFTTPSLGCRSLSRTSLSPFFCLYFLPYLILRRLVCFSGSLGSSASVQMLCGNCSTCRWFFDIFVGEKVVSLSYSFTILQVLLGLVLRCLAHSILTLWEVKLPGC